jgi:hypothetical protein
MAASSIIFFSMRCVAGCESHGDVPWRYQLITPESYSIWRFTSNPHVDQTNKLNVRKSTELFAVHLQVPTGKAGLALGLE